MKPEELQKIKRDTINHYKRMIKWALTQPANERVDLDYMHQELREMWLADYCPCCQAFSDADVGCSKCPLAEMEDMENGWSAIFLGDSHACCCKGLWGKLYNLENGPEGYWDEWVDKALDILDYIRAKEFSDENVDG